MRGVKIKVEHQSRNAIGDQQEPVVSLSVVLKIQCLGGVSRTVTVRFVGSELLI